jgi:hypothetical protein
MRRANQKTQQAKGKNMKQEEIRTAVALANLGLSASEIQTLHRIERTLHGWAERECGTGNGCIDRDEETNKPFWLNATTGNRFPIQDREAGALRRLAKVMEAHPDLVYYHQGDPRGCALYILRVADVDGQPLNQIYTRGIAV